MAPDPVRHLLDWATAALTSAERVLRTDRNYNPWNDVEDPARATVSARPTPR
jgi:hypothetical protein